MIDPIPPPAPFLFKFVKPYADALYLPSLPYHIHEVLLAFLVYQSIQSFVSPVISTFFFPDVYPKFSRRTRINWDVHVVSFIQSVLINALALWIIFCDEERKEMKTSATERVYGYTGVSGLLQGLATGYFVWDVVVSFRYFKNFGPGIAAHAVTALAVYLFGFRPFCNYYGPIFILYELSTPFLNIHWFCDKLNMTGSKFQLCNGIILLATFFGCRLCWGNYQSVLVYQDIWSAMHLNTTSLDLRDVHTSPASSIFVPRDGQLCLGKESCVLAQSEVMQFTGSHTEAVPTWIALIYFICNLTLNSLNFFWFGRMIDALRKRFQGEPHDAFPREKEGQKSIVEEMATDLERNVLSGPITPSLETTEDKAFSTGISDDGNIINKRRKDLSQ